MPRAERGAVWAALHFARAEWRMHRRSLRSALLFVLLALLSRYFFLREYGLAVGGERWRSVGGTLAAWALDPIGAALLLCGLLFSVDAAGWALRPAYREVLYPRPFSNGALILGRFLGIYALLCLFALVPPITLAVLVGMPGGPSLDLTACLFALLHLWLPGLAAMAASALWIRGLAPGTLGAGAAALVFWALLLSGSLALPEFSRFHLPLANLRMEQGYLGGAGLLLLSRPLWGFMLALFFLTAFFLAAAAFQLDRTGRRVARRGARWWQAPTLGALLASFWPGASPGRTALGLLLLGAGGLAGLGAADLAAFRAHVGRAERLERELAELLGDSEAHRVGDLQRLEAMVLGDVPAPARVLARELDFRFDPAGGHLDAVATLTLATPSGQPLLFQLNPGLTVERVEMETGAPVAFRRRFNQLEIELAEGVPSDASRMLRIAYRGSLLTRAPDVPGQPAWKQYAPALPARRFAYLDPALGWFPEPAAVSPLASSDDAANRSGPALARTAAPPQTAPFLARATGARGLRFVAGGVETAPGQWRGHGAVRDLGLMLGDYRILEGTLPSLQQGRRAEVALPDGDGAESLLPLRIYHLPGSREAARLYLWDGEILVREMADLLGRYPFPRLTVVETPVEVAPTAGAGLLCLSSRDLMKVARALEAEARAEWVDLRQRFRYLDPWQVKLLQAQLLHDYLQAGVVAVSPLLSEALPRYLGHVLASHERALAMSERSRDFDVLPGQAAYYRIPLAEAEARRFPGRTEVLAKRSMALFHMLRYRLGEERWRQLLRDYAEGYRFRPADWPDFLALAERRLGESLADFHREWILEGALPQYEILRAHAVMFNDPATLGMDYRVTLEVANHGSGSTPAPVYLRTERDRIFRHPRIPPGESVILRLEVPDRPLFAEIDPQGWILQLPRHMQESDTWAHDYRKVEIFEAAERSPLAPLGRSGP